MQLQAVFCRAASASMAPTLPRKPGGLSKGPHPLCPAASSVRQRHAAVTHAALNRDEAARDRRLSVPRLAKRRIERCFVANAPEQNTPISSAFLRRGASTRPATVRSGESSERPARAAQGAALCAYIHPCLHVSARALVALRLTQSPRKCAVRPAHLRERC